MTEIRTRFSVGFSLVPVQVLGSDSQRDPLAVSYRESRFWACEARRGAPASPGSKGDQFLFSRGEISISRFSADGRSKKNSA